MARHPEFVAYTYDSVRALGDTIRVLERRYMPDSEHPDPGAHMHLTLAMPYFVAGLEEAKRIYGGLGENHPSFLDVGCGLGTAMLVAKCMDFHAYGIDIFPPYVHEANRIAGRARCIDAFEYDGYGSFDVVYMYKPRRDNDEQAELERHVVEGMRPGALAFFVGLDTVPGCEELDYNLWRKRDPSTEEPKLGKITADQLLQ